MAEALLWISDKDAPLVTPLEDLGPLPQAGDMIGVCPDAWPWTERELTHPQWRVTALAAVPHERLRDMLEPVMDPLTGKMLLASAVVLDRDSAIFAYIKNRPSIVRLDAAQTAAFMAARRLRKAPTKVRLE